MVQELHTSTANRVGVAQIVVNSRVLSAPLTGTHRYTAELLERWRGEAQTLSPKNNRRAFSGHGWEQLVLPGLLGNRLLFSPSNTGPLSVTRQVITIHDTSVFDCPETFSRTFSSWYRFLLPKLARRVRRVIAVSEFVKGRLLELTGVDPARVVVIPNGVAGRFCPEAVAGLDEAISSLHIPSRKYVLAVGSLELRKNLARLFHAWDRVQAQIPDDLWLIVVGACQSRIFAGVRFEKLPERIFLAGHVRDSLLPALFAGARFLAYVSYYEGFGLPPLEAMASGTAVLASNRTAVPEIVGDAALLVDPFNVDDIAAALHNLATNSLLRESLRKQGQHRAKQFSWDDAACQTWKVLQEAVVAD